MGRFPAMFSFTLFRFKIIVQPYFWILSGLIGLSFAGRGDDMVPRLLIWVTVSFLSVLWHELGHAFAFRRCGVESEIVLHGMGGYAVPVRPVRLSRGQDIFISAAGPTFQLLIGIPLLLLLWNGKLNDFLQGKQFAGPTIWALIFVNIAWPVMNLLPVYPLDGGRISHALFGPRKENIALGLSLICAIGVAVWAVTVKQPFVAILFGMMAYNNWCRLTGRPEAPM